MMYFLGGDKKSIMSVELQTSQSISKAWFLNITLTAVKIYTETGTTTQEFLKVRLIYTVRHMFRRFPHKGEAFTPVLQSFMLKQ